MDQSTLPRTVTLKERQSAICRLTSADIDFLRAEHRTHFDIAPTGRRGWYRVSPTGHVGVVVAPSCRLVIRPKIPVENLFFLLDPAAPPPACEDHVSAAPGAEVVDFLAGRLAQLLAERAAAGLHRAYVERMVHGPFLQGRLDLASQLRDPNGRKDRFHCCYEDFTTEVPCNQVPRATAEEVLQFPLLDDRVRASLRGALAAFPGVGSIPLERSSFDTLLADPLTLAYRPLLELCRLLFESLSSDGGAGAVSYPAFLLDMERVFESFCLGHCLSASVNHIGNDARFTLSVQPYYQVNQPVAGQPDLHVRPDLTLNRDGRPLLVLDAKWKWLPKSSLITSDVYQVLAYCTALGIDRAVLVYPGKRNMAWTYKLNRTSTTLIVRKLRVVGSRESLEKSGQLLGKSLWKGCGRG